jgi:peptidoglycan/LPS O-acetylase OafA/YrhL
MGWVGLLAIASATVSFSGGTAFPGYAALLPTVGAALVIGAGVGDEQPRLGVGRLLALAPMRYVGDRSYALYLWHWPVLVIALQYEQRALSVGVKLVLLVGAFLLSVASYRYFENPLRRSSWRPNTGLLLWPATAAAVVVVAATALHGIHDKVAHLDSAAAAASGLTAQAPAVGGGTDPSVCRRSSPP